MKQKKTTTQRHKNQLNGKMQSLFFKRLLFNFKSREANIELYKKIITIIATIYWFDSFG